MDNGSKQVIKNEVSSYISDEVSKLRIECFPDMQGETALDQFDSCSQHFTFKINESIIAYGRLTPGPNAVLARWSQGKADIPLGKDVIDLGRCLVNPNYRGMNLYKLLCAKAIRYADLLGFNKVVGAFEPGRKFANSVYKMGFINSGDPVNFTLPNGEINLAQPAVCDIKATRKMWQDVINVNSSNLLQMGFSIVDAYGIQA